MTNSSPLHIPALRLGKPYQSLDRVDVKALGTGEVVAQISTVNAGIIKRDARKLPDVRNALAAIPSARILEICAEAGRQFMTAALPLGDTGETQTPDQYVSRLSSTSGMPHALIRRNMTKINHVLTHMSTILRGLTRGLDLAIIDNGTGVQAGVPVSYFAATDALGIILPSNSPAVNSLWLPAFALKIPVVLKPGKEEPWTPWRIIQAFIAAGAPAEAFGFYPTDHEGSAAVMEACGKSLIFGDQATVDKYAANPNVEAHGPGWSKVVIGADQIEHWRDHLDTIVESIAANGGRSCINASAVVVPSHADEIASALAERLAQLVPRPADDPKAGLASFANPAMADFIENAIEQGLKTPGATDLSAALRNHSPRKVSFEGRTYLLPTVVRADSFDHPLANKEFLFPYASVVEVPQDQVLQKIGPSLVVTAITDDPDFKKQLLRSPNIQRLNLGPIATIHVEWDQPHEGNLFEFLYHRRAIQHAPLPQRA
jgi:hypothetical protein